MKRLALLLILFISASVSGQSSNAPEVVFPIVEKFISEAHQHEIPVHKIREIDSVNIARLPWPLSGLHLSGATYNSLTLNPGRSRSAEKTFYHEIGHMFGLQHTDRPRKIMNLDPSDPWFENETNWQKAKDEFFTALKSLQ